MSVSTSLSSRDALPDGHYALRLDGGVYQGGRHSAAEIDLVREGGKWNSVPWAFFMEFNAAEHPGEIAATVEDGSGRVTLDMEFPVYRDAYSDSTEASYRVVLVEGARGVDGYFEGRFSGRPVAGSVAVERSSPRRVPEGFVPPAPGEHPRLLLRRKQIPELRRRADTERGRSIVAILRESVDSGRDRNARPVALGFLYHITGEDRYAEALRGIAENWLEMGGKSVYAGSRDQLRMLEWAERTVEVALAYDFAAEAWDDAFRERVERFLALAMTGLIRGGGPGWNPSPWSNWNAHARAAAGLSAMLLADKYPFPVPAADEFPNIPEIAGGREILDTDDALEVALRGVRRWMDHALGDRGWNAEGEIYTSATLRSILPFLHGYRNMTGINALSGTNGEWAIPVYAWRYLVGPGGMDVSRIGVGGGINPRMPGILAYGFDLVPDAWKPGVLWTWNRLLEMDPEALSEASSPTGWAMSLLHYPENGNEVNPAMAFPRVYRDRQKGAYAFRNRWRDGDDIIATVFAKSDFRRASWSRPDAGIFRISGLGHHWAVWGDVAKSGGRNLETVVQVPEEIAQMLGAEEVFFDGRPDGSGSVTLKLDRLYRKPKGGALVTLDGTVNLDALEDQGLRGRRVFAVDFGKESGAAAVFVLVDTVRGSADPVWQMFADNSVLRESDPRDVEVDGNTFYVRPRNGTATMRGVFLEPEQAAVVYEDGAVSARGGETFAVVMTLSGSGEHPEVRREDDGSVTVGGLSLQYDTWRVRMAR
ncbi:MAG: hypothetical protein JJU00_16000 [Opitutales bacterium]|nr:hypothetical protein [Opitutales bacterium]